MQRFLTKGRAVVTDRRAGRLSTAENKRITELLSEKIKDIDGVKVGFYPGLEHRFVLKLTFPREVISGGDKINDTDPQKVDLSPLVPTGSNGESSKIARVINKLVDNISRIIVSEKKPITFYLEAYQHFPIWVLMKKSMD